jgi:hypothetical protein
MARLSILTLMPNILAYWSLRALQSIYCLSDLHQFAVTEIVMMNGFAPSAAIEAGKFGHFLPVFVHFQRLLEVTMARSTTTLPTR